MTSSERRHALEAAQGESRELARTLDSDAVLRAEATSLAEALEQTRVEVESLEQVVQRLRAAQLEQRQEVLRLDGRLLGAAEPYEVPGRRKKQRRTLRADHVLFGFMAGALWATCWLLVPGLPLNARGALALVPGILSSAAFLRGRGETSTPPASPD